jgi:hypothetical protein
MALLALWPIVLFLAVILLVGWLVRRWNAREAERWRREIEQPTKPLRTLPRRLTVCGFETCAKTAAWAHRDNLDCFRLTAFQSVSVSLSQFIS